MIEIKKDNPGMGFPTTYDLFVNGECVADLGEWHSGIGKLQKELQRLQQSTS